MTKALSSGVSLNICSEQRRVLLSSYTKLDAVYMAQFSTKNGHLLCVLGIKHDNSVFGAHLKMGFKVYV